MVYSSQPFHTVTFMSFSVLDSLPSVEEEDATQKPTSGEDGDEDMDHPESCLPVEEEDVDKIVACLEEIHRLFAQPQHLIVSEERVDRDFQFDTV